MRKNQNLIEALKGIILKGAAANQEEIGAQLEKRGFEINQTKISRLLRKMGAVRVQSEEGGSVYRLPLEPLPPSGSSHLANLVQHVEANEILIIVNTVPGAASLMARLLDYNKDKCKILGTVAGDDTIIAIPKSIKEIKKSLREVKNLLRGV